jgi:CRISPR-associated protein Cas5d
LRNAIGQIFWKPEMHLNGGSGYQITRVAIKKPIKTISITRNEITKVIKKTKSVGSKNKTFNPINVTSMRNDALNIEGVRTQRTTEFLTDIEYVVEFFINFPDGEFKRTDNHISKVNTVTKYENQLDRRLESGACFRQPCFGQKECSADYELVTKNEMKIEKNVVPDMIIYNMLYESCNLNNLNEKNPSYANIEVKDGIIYYPLWQDVKDR